MRVCILIAAMLLAGPALAQQTMSQQLQGLLGKGGNNNIGSGLAVGVLLGCTSQAAGGEATQAFYKQMQAVGEQVGQYCKQHQFVEARELVLHTLETQYQHPVAQAANRCYMQKREDVNQLAGNKAVEFRQYARWSADPQLARQEMQATDICR